MKLLKKIAIWLGLIILMMILWVDWSDAWEYGFSE